MALIPLPKAMPYEIPEEGLAMTVTGNASESIPQDLQRQEQLQELARERAADPRAYCARLRAKSPLDFREGQDGTVQVLKRADVERVLRDTASFSNVMGLMGSEEPLIPLGVDPPEHARYRRLLDPQFSRKRMAELEPTVTARVNQLIDTFIENGECDFSTDIA